jgi:hypothetical protein
MPQATAQPRAIQKGGSILTLSNNGDILRMPAKTIKAGIRPSAQFSAPAPRSAAIPIKKPPAFSVNPDFICAIAGPISNDRDILGIPAKPGKAAIGAAARFRAPAPGSAAIQVKESPAISVDPDFVSALAGPVSDNGNVPGIPAKL